MGTDLESTLLRLQQSYPADRKVQSWAAVALAGSLAAARLLVIVLEGRGDPDDAGELAYQIAHESEWSDLPAWLERLALRAVPY